MAGRGRACAYRLHRQHVVRATGTLRSLTVELRHTGTECGGCGARQDVNPHRIDVWDTDGRGTFAVKPHHRCACGHHVYADAAIVEQREAPEGSVIMRRIDGGEQVHAGGGVAPDITAAQPGRPTRWAVDEYGAIAVTWHYIVEAESAEAAIALVKAGEADPYDQSSGDSLDPGESVEPDFTAVRYD